MLRFRMYDEVGYRIYIQSIVERIFYIKEQGMERVYESTSELYLFIYHIQIK